MKSHNTSKYANSYLIYTRKSTDDSDNQKNSIAYQKTECVRYAARERLSIAPIDIEHFCTSGIVAEKHTGFKEDLNWLIKKDGTVQYKIERPKFYRLVEALHNGEFKGVIFLCWDRASRNKSDDSIIDKLMRGGVDIRFVQATYDKTSAGELHMDIDGMFSRHYSRVISEKVILANVKLKNEGVCTYRAPVGYQNLGDARNKPFDPVRAPLIKALFEKYALGVYSLHDLAVWANEQGLTMPPAKRRRTMEEMLSEEECEIESVSRPLTFKNVQKILLNRFYIGEILGNDGLYTKSTSHKALISKKLFDTVQEKLGSRRKQVTYNERLPYPYRGVFRCRGCMRVYTPYEKKGTCYFGARCDKSCSNPQKSFNQPFIEFKVGETIAGMAFKPEEIEFIRKASYTDSTRERELQKRIEEQKRNEYKLNEDMEYLKENRLVLLRTGVYTPETFQEELHRLLDALVALKNTSPETNLKEKMESAIKLSELTKRLLLTYNLVETPKKEALIPTVFSELLVSDESLLYKGADGFRIFERRFMALGDPTGWNSELNANGHLIDLSIDKLTTLLKNSYP